MISAMAVPSFMTVAPLGMQAGSVRPSWVSWNRILPSGKARAAHLPGSADMRFDGNRVGPCARQGCVQGCPCSGAPLFKAVTGRACLPRFAAAMKHRSHQAENVSLDAVLGDGRRIGGARILGLLAEKPDVVLCPLTLLRGHFALAPESPMQRTWTGSVQSVVNFPSRMNTGRGGGFA